MVAFDLVVDTPPCAVCGQLNHGRRAQHHLTHGVTVWLCETHRTDSYLSRSGGMAFVERLTAVWAASDGLTSRRRKALSFHLRTIRGAAATRDLPGSYSWPVLRREAERRFAAGEPPADVIAELRRTHADAPAVVPSVRTMRRWFTQARWLVTQRRRTGVRARTTQPRSGPLTPREQLVNLLLTGYAYQPRNPERLLRGP